ncbi:MAG: glycoside hydrolase family 2 TIM barrel-domain containing protein [Armatimonadota bacterium]|nr:glycoside hydrolase family 2 TIM barrel-domain containing protein [Armatimonadota bacterium]
MIEDSFDLSNGWRICREPDSAPGGWATSQDFDDSNWRALRALKHLQVELLPGDDRWWGDNLRDMNSTAWLYRLRFDLPKDWSGSAIDLDFGAVDYHAEVRLNGKPVGEHEGNFAPFSFPIEDVIQEKDNLLAVRVRAPFGIPHDCAWQCIRDSAKGLYEHADGLIPPDVNPIGIWRPVSLRRHSGIRPSRPFADTLKLSKEEARIKLRCPVNSRTDIANATVRVVIRGETFDEETLKEEFRVDLPAGSSEITREYDLRNPRLWTIWQRGKPHLYRADVEILVNKEPVAEVSGTFGVRTVELIRKPLEFKFLLNGEPLFIKGTTYIPTCYLSEMTEEVYRKDIELAKAAHCNLLRSHVHVDNPEFYDICDREGLLVMQDFELNWLHPDTIEFERRVLPIFREMVELLRPHPSVAFWMCFNESLPSNPRLHTDHPSPALYAEAIKMDSTRPVFLVSGLVEEDWEKSGDSHYYQGSLSGADYWMFLEHKDKFNTEYGCTAPGSRETLKAHPKAAKSAANVFRHIQELWDYQYRIIKFITENYRRQKYAPCTGCVHFMLVDMFPQIGLGVLDFNRVAKGGYYGLAEGFAPVLVSLEHRETPRALWIVNDQQESFDDCELAWSIHNPEGALITSGSQRLDVKADSAVRVISFAKANLPIEPGQDCTVLLTLTQPGGATLASNRYVNPFKFPKRPNGYPMLFDDKLGMKLYGYED